MRYHRIKKFIGIVLFLVQTSVLAQTLPSISTPQPAVPKTYIQSYPYHNPQTQILDPVGSINIQKQNEAIVMSIKEHQQHINAEMQRQSVIKTLVNNGFPSQMNQPGTSYFYSAFNEIDSMLKRQLPLNLARAVFLTENASYEDSLSYEEYKKFIKDKATFCNTKIREEKLDADNNMVKNLMIFSLLTDTLEIRFGNKTVTNYPVRYNLDDYQSKINYDSHFVTKLM